MTTTELKIKYQKANPNGHFFDADTLRFFGETFSGMNVLSKTEKIMEMGIEKECYVLTSYQRKHPLGPRRVRHYFDTKTFDHVIPD